jgi:hypothetical protein
LLNYFHYLLYPYHQYGKEMSPIYEIQSGKGMKKELYLLGRTDI